MRGATTTVARGRRGVFAISKSGDYAQGGRVKRCPQFRKIQHEENTWKSIEIRIPCFSGSPESPKARFSSLIIATRESWWLVINIELQTTMPRNRENGSSEEMSGRCLGELWMPRVKRCGGGGLFDVSKQVQRWNNYLKNRGVKMLLIDHRSNNDYRTAYRPRITSTPTGLVLKLVSQVV